MNLVSFNANSSSCVPWSCDGFSVGTAADVNFGGKKLQPMVMINCGRSSFRLLQQGISWVTVVLTVLYQIADL